jgi:hypothetical protein
MDSQQHAPADLTPVPISEGCVGPRAGPDFLEKRKISPARIQTLHRPVLSLITTTTELSWIHYNILTFIGRTSPLAVHQKGGGPTKFCLSGPRMDISSTVTRSVAWTIVSAVYCQQFNRFCRPAGDPLTNVTPRTAPSWYVIIYSLRHYILCVRVYIIERIHIVNGTYNE